VIGVQVLAAEIREDVRSEDLGEDLFAFSPIGADVLEEVGKEEHLDSVVGKDCREALVLGTGLFEVEDIVEEEDILIPRQRLAVFAARLMNEDHPEPTDLRSHAPRSHAQTSLIESVSESPVAIITITESRLAGSPVQLVDRSSFHVQGSGLEGGCPFSFSQRFECRFK
jgi:hypothetical protein